LTVRSYRDSIIGVRLHREMMRTLATEIVAGDLAEGEWLPKEVELAKKFDISRGVAREGIRALEERGLLKVRHGRGAAVAPREGWDLFDPDVITVLLEGPAATQVLGDYLECRRILEVDAAGLAAERATPEAIKALSAWLEAMDDATRSRTHDAEAAFHRADVGFHEELLAATGNRALATLARRIHAALLAARYPLARPAYRKQRAMPEHRAIFEAVGRQDPDAARAAMSEHLATVGRYLEEHARRVARGGR
jgi:GntR family transcriptional repressor for pyruvate dehydrogenase complex